MRGISVTYFWMGLFLVWSSLNGLHAQTVQVDTSVIKFDQLGVDQGLAAGMIWGLIQDKKGFLWTGTSTALNRYDGYEVEKFQNIQGDSLSLPIAFTDNVKPIFSDKYNNIWLNHPYQGTLVFRWSNESFLPVNGGVGQNGFTDERNNIWYIDTDDGGWRIIPEDSISEDPANMRTQKSLRLEQKFKGLNDLPGIFLCTLGDDIWWVENDTIYAYTLNYLKGTASVKVKRKIPEGFIDPSLTRPWLIEDLHYGTLYLFGISQYGQINTENGEFIFRKSFPQPFRNPSPTIFDSEGYVWLFIGNAGLFRLQAQEGKLFDIRMQGQEKKNISILFTCNHLLEDKDGNIWIGTAGYGLFKCSKATRQFGYFGNNHTGPSMGKIYATRSGEVAFDRRSILLFDRKKNSVREFIKPSALLPPGSDIKGTKFQMDDFGNYWLSIFLKDQTYWIFKINEEGKVLLKIPSDQIHSPFLEKGLYLFNEGDSFWKILFSSNEEEPGTRIDLAKCSEKVQETLEEYSFQMDNRYRDYKRCTAVSKEWVWLGLTGCGLAGFNRRTKTWRQYVHRSEDSNLSTNQILCLLPDPMAPDSILWIGTSDGLNKMDITKGIFTRFGTQNGFPNDVIYGILEDDYHNFWMSSNNGLFLFNPESQTVLRTFSREDGLQHTEFNYNAYAKAPDGIFYFGGVGGLTFFNPEDFYKDTIPSQVVIKELRLFNKKVDFSRVSEFQDAKFNLDKPLLAEEKLQFDHTQRMITFEFAVLDLTKPSKNQYRFKLEGFSEDWVDLGYQNEATFTNLDAGDYTLLVEGCNHAGVWNSKAASIKFTILPAWWETWWFRTMAIVLLLGIITLFFFFKQKQEEKLQALRNRISQDIHDEIGSTLTSISLFGVVALKSLTDKESVAHKMITRINQSTVQVVESISDIVWTINSDNDKIGDLINRMRAYAAEWMENGDWNIHFETDKEILNIPMNMVQRRNVYLIFKEALHNAFKYSEGKNLTVSFQRKDKNLILTIQDDGKGFKPNNGDTKPMLGGNGIKNMQRRTTELKGVLEVNTIEGSGTRVQLSFNPKLKLKHV